MMRRARFIRRLVVLHPLLVPFQLESLEPIYDVKDRCQSTGMVRHEEEGLTEQPANSSNNLQSTRTLRR